MKSLPPYANVNFGAKFLSFHLSTRGANDHEVFHQGYMQIILGFERSRYKRMRSTRIKENCTITGFDGKHTENHVRLILSFFSRHMVYSPDQLVLSSCRAELSVATLPN